MWFQDYNYLKNSCGNLWNLKKRTGCTCLTKDCNYNYLHMQELIMIDGCASLSLHTKNNTETLDHTRKKFINQINSDVHKYSVIINWIIATLNSSKSKRCLFPNSKWLLWNPWTTVILYMPIGKANQSIRVEFTQFIKCCQIKTFWGKKKKKRRWVLCSDCCAHKVSSKV